MPRRAALLALAVTISGCVGSPGHRGPPTAHFDGTRFHNVPPVDPPGVLDLLAWQWNPDDIGWPDEAPPVVPVKPPSTVERGIRVTLVNHATVLVQIDGASILTDPIYAERVGPVSFLGPRRWAEPGVREVDLPRLDAIVVSHDHHDHCDVHAIRRLVSRGNTPVVAGLGTAALLAEHDVATGVDLDWWETTRVSEHVAMAAGRRAGPRPRRRARAAARFPRPAQRRECRDPLTRATVRGWWPPVRVRSVRSIRASSSPTPCWSVSPRSSPSRSSTTR